jgi:hypothetical protein
MEWGQSIDILGDARTALYFILLGVSLLLNSWQYLIKPYKPKEFLSGRWKGHLSAQGSSEVKIIVTLFKESDEISGFVLYEGFDQEKRTIRGIDRLASNSDRLVFSRVWNKEDFWRFLRFWRFPLFVNFFTTKMSQQFHVIGDQMSTDSVGTLYNYEFEVIRRGLFGRGTPRMRVSVAPRVIQSDQPSRKLEGQIYKVKGG